MYNIDMDSPTNVPNKNLDSAFQDIKPKKRTVTKSNLIVLVAVSVMFIAITFYRLESKGNVTISFVLCYFSLYAVFFLTSKIVPRKMVFRVIKFLIQACTVILWVGLIALLLEPEYRNTDTTSDEIERRNALANLDTYNDNKVLTKIGEVGPLEIRSYEVRFDNAANPNLKPIYIFKTLDNNAESVKADVLGVIGHSFYDTGSHIIFIYGNILTIYNKASFEVFDQVFSENFVEEDFVRIGLEITRLSEKQVLISQSAAYSGSEGKDASPGNFYVLDESTDNLRRFNCQENSDCRVYLHGFIGSNVYLLEEQFMGSSGQCAYVGKYYLVLDMNNGTIRRVGDPENTCIENKLIGFSSKSAIFYRSTEAGTQVFSIDLYTGISKVLINETYLDKKPSFYTYKYIQSSGGNFVNINKKGSESAKYYITYDLDNDEIVSSLEVVEDSYPPTVGTVIKNISPLSLEGVKELPLNISEVTKVPLTTSEINEITSENIGVYTLILKDSSKIIFRVAGLGDLFSALLPNEVAMSEYTDSYALSKLFSVSDKGMLFELTKYSAANAPYSRVLLDEFDSSYSKRVGYLEIDSGNVFLVDHNRVTEIVDYNDSKKVLILLSPYEGNKYRIIDLASGKPLASFVLGDWYTFESDPIYGPNLQIPLIEYFKLEANDSGYCFNNHNIRVKCIVMPYKFKIDVNSVSCTDEACSLDITVDEDIPIGTSTGEMRADAEKTGRKVNVQIQGSKSYILNSLE